MRRRPRGRSHIEPVQLPGRSVSRSRARPLLAAAQPTRRDGRPFRVSGHRAYRSGDAPATATATPADRRPPRNVRMIYLQLYRKIKRLRSTSVTFRLAPHNFGATDTVIEVGDVGIDQPKQQDEDAVARS